jgi:hypothetical protein
MALWGKRDSFAVTGTVAFVNTSNQVVGTGTNFVNQLDIGDMIITSGGVKFKVVGVTNAEHILISPSWPTDNASGQTITGQDTPKYLYHTDGRKTFGVDSVEAQVNDKDAGWILRNTYTDMHGITRVKNEVLVAMSSISGDAEDVVYPDAIITVLSQPSSNTGNTADAATFTVVASIDPAGTTINYRWQESDGANAFVNLTDTGVYSDTNTDTLTISDNTGLDGYVYRAQLSATGVTANTVTANAELTVV